MQLTSPAFANDGVLPKKFTADGPNVSPPLEWSGAPATTKSFALICDDPDAPRETWVHWVLFNIPANVHDLPEGVPQEKVVLGSAKQGTNSFREIGYNGPSPPKGPPHRYVFKIYALEVLLDLKERATMGQLEAAMMGHILTKGKLTGKYGR
ncbi:MAG: YbhB/YbcL family Raf kinase inhibitor-like protein [Planctomycetes bacterium]|nr:YbhB/YbcL family Raf kinase inhibitor-like protein [Planctomycetota bacterium]